MSPAQDTAAPPAERNGAGPTTLTKEALADRTRFKFKEEVLELPELGGSIRLKSLSVEERESLPDLVDEDEVTTETTIKKLAQVFSVIVAEPKVSAEEATEFLGSWPAECLDRLTAAYGKMVGSKEDEKAATAEFKS